jgi:hypothetical protein
MEADVPFVTGLTKDEIIAAIHAATDRHCADAFAADCRLAIRWNVTNLCFHRFPMTIEYQFVVLSPGEGPPPGQGWELWEDHSGVARGRAI